MSEKKAIRVAYGEALCKLGVANEKIVVLDADLAAATMTKDFFKTYPNRAFDCGIAEANMVDMAAGMSAMESANSTAEIPVRRIASSFSTWASWGRK